MSAFGARLAQAIGAHGPLCVGIDPNPQLLTDWGLPDTAAGVRQFSRVLLEALTGRVAAVKPQVAFFERHGSAGMAVLEEIVGHGADFGLLTIIDAKRGDIGSTMAGYADAYLREGAPFAGDAVTISPYLGANSLAETAATASANNRGIFILALTSNPEGAEVQHAQTANGDSVAARVATFAATCNSGATPMGDIGLVVGATVGDAPQRLGIDLAQVNGPLLAPGVGAQGAGVADVLATFGAAARQVLVTSSRGILKVGPDPHAIVSSVEKLSTTLDSLQNAPS